ncbi:MAG: hypothetical protein ACK4JB_12055 [Reyranella sp.]
MMAEGESLEALLTRMRTSFGERQWNETVELFGELSGFSKVPRNIRVEATCLAARSMIALQNRPAARKMLSGVAGIEHAKAASYAHLAQAYMDLKNYREVVRLCERVIELEDAAKDQV